MFRKLGILCCLALLPLQAANLPTSLEQGWQGNPFSWKGAEGAIEAVNSGGSLIHQAFPLSHDASIAATVTVGRRTKATGYGVAGVGLVRDGRNFYHLALVETPPNPEGKSRHFIELHQCWNGGWPMNDNLAEVEVTAPDMNWQAGKPYRLSLDKRGDTITGTVHDQGGRLMFRRVYRFRDDTPVNAVRPVIKTDLFTARFEAIEGTHGEPATDAARNWKPYRSDSFVRGKSVPATGFFQVRQDPDGRWWAYDPLGRATVIFGTDWVSYGGHGCTFNGRFLHREYNNKRFANQQEWVDETYERLTDWGFNLLHGSDARVLAKGLASANTIGVGDPMATLGDEFDITPNKSAPCTAFPNVFHPKFRAWVRYRITSACAANVDNPWIFGYFIDNELAWWGRGTNYGGLFDAAMRKPATHYAKRHIRDLLRQRANGNLDTLNRDWGLQLASFDDLLTLTALPSATQLQKDIKTQFLQNCAEIYFSTVREEFKAIDPNHLLLGCRFAGIDGQHDIVWKTAAKYSDVVTWNNYGSIDLDTGAAYYGGLGKDRKTIAEAFTRIYDLVRRPTLITEWSFPALDSGLPCTYGAGQRFLTQTERAKATDIYARNLLALPFMIGYDYFMWVDQPPLGISEPFPENTNYGLINLKGEPYQELVAVLKAIQRDPLPVRMSPAPAVRENAAAAETQLLRDRYLARLPRLTRSAPNPAFTLQADGPQSFRAANGRFTAMNGRDPGLVRIDHDGRQVSSYGALLHFDLADGTRFWQDIDTITAVGVAANQEQLVIDFTGTFTPKPEDADRLPKFAIDFRLVMLPNSDWMLAQLVSVRNLSDRPLPIRGLFIRFFPDFDGQRGCATEIPLQAVPRLWAPLLYSGYVAPDKIRRIGVAASRRADITLHCWMDKKRGTYHPDIARFYSQPVLLQPGETHTPSDPHYVMFLAGKGTYRDMMQQALSHWK